MNDGASVAESVSEEREEDSTGQIQVHRGIPQIPFDLFIEKTRKHVRFTDPFGNLVYIGALHSSLSPHPHPRRALLDSSSNPLVSILRSDRSWKAFKGDGSSAECLFRVERTLNTSSKQEFDVFLIKEDREDLDMTMRGCLYWRSCSIYTGNTIVAQTSLMYKLGFKKISKIFVRRSKFRVTFFPGYYDYNLVAALILIFLDGR